MNYPYGLQPRTFQLSKREWAVSNTQISTLGRASTRPLALTDGPAHADTVPHKGRTQISPQPPAVSPKKRSAPSRSFLSITDWSVSANDGTNNVYRPRKPHHLPPIAAARSPRAHRSSVVRAHSVVRANRQAALHYEQAVEAAERQTLEGEEHRERQQLRAYLEEQTALWKEVSVQYGAPEEEEEEEKAQVAATPAALPTLYAEDECEVDRSVLQEDAPRAVPENPLPALCGCHEWSDIDCCRRQVARDLVDALLTPWERQCEATPEAPSTPADQVALTAQAAGTRSCGPCACATRADIDVCRHHQAEQLVALILEDVQSQSSPLASPTKDSAPLAEDLAALRQHEAESLVDDVLASIQGMGVDDVCTCTSNNDVRSCRQRFVEEMVNNALLCYV